MTTYILDYRDGMPPASIVYDQPGFRISPDSPDGYNYSQQFRPTSDHMASTFTLTLTLAEAGEIAFWQRASSELNYDRLSFSIDGVSQGNWSGDTPWSRVTFPVGAGNHTFTWTYGKDGADGLFLDTAFVTGIEVTNVTDPPPTQVPGAGLQKYGFEDGVVPPTGWSGTWVDATDWATEGTHSAKSDVGSSNFVTRMTLDEPYAPEVHGLVSYDWRVSSELNYVYFKFLVDDVPVRNYSGEKSGSDSYILSSGPHSLAFEFERRIYGTPGQFDAAWIDNLSIMRDNFVTPGTPDTLRIGPGLVNQVYVNGSAAQALHLGSVAMWTRD